jgi:hypothetical protein
MVHSRLKPPLEPTRSQLALIESWVPLWSTQSPVKIDADEENDEVSDSDRGVLD